MTAVIRAPYLPLLLDKCPVTVLPCGGTGFAGESPTGSFTFKLPVAGKMIPDVPVMFI